jgi:hypothetical protein
VGKLLEQLLINRDVSLMLGTHSFGPDGLSRVHVIQFDAIGMIVTGAQGLFLYEAICHE